MDEAFTASALLALQRIALHLPLEVHDAGIVKPVLALCASEQPETLRAGAAQVIEMLAADEEVGISMVKAGAAPTLVSLALHEHRHAAHGVEYTAMRALLALSEKRINQQSIANGEPIHSQLLDLAAPTSAYAPYDARGAHLCVLSTLVNLGGVGEFKSLLSAETRFFPLLFRLRDSGIDDVTLRSHQLASHWADEFFGWAWACCTRCKEVAAALMLDAEPAPGASQQRGGVEQYTTQLVAIHGQFKEFLRQVDEVSSGLLHTQEKLDDSLALCACLPCLALPHLALCSLPFYCAPRKARQRASYRVSYRASYRASYPPSYRAPHPCSWPRVRPRAPASTCRSTRPIPMRARRCERYTRVMRQQRIVADDPTEPPMLPGAPVAPARAFVEHVRDVSRRLESCLQAVRASYREALLHCNLLLDNQGAVRRAEAHLDELHAIVEAGKGVEVTFQWKLEAHAALKRALVSFALRLELHVRALVSQVCT